METTMESILLFDKFLSSTDSKPIPSLCSPTEEEIMFEDSFANEIYMKFVDDSGENIDLFTEIDNNDKKMIDDEFPFIDNKSHSPINDFVTPTISGEEEDIKNNSFNINDNDKNEQLMMEFNSILDAVSNNELTPPQTPPPEIFQIHEVIGTEYQQLNNIPVNQYEVFGYEQSNEIVETTPTSSEQFIFIQNNSSSPQSSTYSYYEESNEGMEVIFDPESIISSPADIERELEVVDELVRAHSRNNTDFDDNASQFSSISAAWSPRSEISSNNSSYSSDYEPKSRNTSSLKGITKKRTRPYGRNPEEKKSRKKEQNKNAATRYRQKKKVEIEIISDQEKVLADRNRKLFGIYKETRREVKYLKSLLRDLFKARGFI